MISKPVCLALLVLSSYTLASPLPQAEGEEEGIINVPRKLDNTIFFVQAELLTMRPPRLLLGSSMILHFPFFQSSQRQVSLLKQSMTKVSGTPKSQDNPKVSVILETNGRKVGLKTMKIWLTNTQRSKVKLLFAFSPSLHILFRKCPDSEGTCQDSSGQGPRHPRHHPGADWQQPRQGNHQVLRQRLLQESARGLVSPCRGWSSWQRSGSHWFPSWEGLCQGAS